MILDVPIWILIGVTVVILNWFGIHPDWDKAQIRTPPLIKWLLWLYVVALCLGYVSIGLIILSLIF